MPPPCHRLRAADQRMAARPWRKGAVPGPEPAARRAGADAPPSSRAAGSRANVLACASRRPRSIPHRRRPLAPGTRPVRPEFAKPGCAIGFDASPITLADGDSATCPRQSACRTEAGSLAPGLDFPGAVQIGRVRSRSAPAKSGRYFGPFHCHGDHPPAIAAHTRGDDNSSPGRSDRSANHNGNWIKHEPCR